MNQALSSLKLGQRTEAKISDVLASGDVIVSFEGQLLRIYNQTNKKFSIGQRVELEVTGIKPLRFQLCERGFKAGRVHFSV